MLRLPRQMLQGGTTVTEQTMGAIANVDDLPTGADKTLTVTEDTALVVTLADFGYADEDTPYY